MRCNVILIFIFVCLFMSSSYANGSFIWFTGSKGFKLINPGVEAGFVLHKNFGIQLGLASYIMISSTREISQPENSKEGGIF